MKISLGSLNQVKKKQAGGRRPSPPRQPAAKKQKVALGGPSASARASVPQALPTSDDEVEEVAAPPTAAPTPPIPRRPTPPAPIPARPVSSAPARPTPSASTRSAPPPTSPTRSRRQEAQRKGKTSIVSCVNHSGEEFGHVEVSVPNGTSAIRDKNSAEEIMRSFLLPEDLEMRRNKSLEDLLKSFYPGLTKMAVDISIIQDGLHHFAGLNRKLREQSEAAAADLQVSEERRLAGEAREAKMAVEKKKLAEEKNRLAEGKKELADQCNRLAEERDTSLAQLRSLKEQLKEKEEKLASEREYSSQLEVRIANADGRLDASEKEAEALRLDLETAKDRAAEEYKSSSDFELAVAEGCMESFHLGFNLCKKVAAKTFPGLAVSRIEEPEDLEGWETADEETAEANTEDPVPTPVAAEAEETQGEPDPINTTSEKVIAETEQSPIDVPSLAAATEVPTMTERSAEGPEAGQVELVEE